MDRFNDETNELIDFGSVTTETKGIPGNNSEDTGGVRKLGVAGLSDD